ncbi:MAG: hypothetical protein HKM89_03985, partial [Gemmatimonadales bacterium]|nr:hypothetical protein [Gemmatimonadales bacterium]
FQRMVHNYLSTIDISCARIKQTMETGQDPGEEDPLTLAKRIAGSGGLPPKLQKAIDDLLGAKKEGPRKRGAKKEEAKKKGTKKKPPEVTHI